MRVRNIEGSLAWWNELAGGVGLLLGYALYGVFWLLTPETVVEIEVTRPIYRAEVIGQIPATTSVNALPGIPTRAELAAIEAKQDVIEMVPQFDADGRPRLETTRERFSGLGQANIQVDRNEILIPKLLDPPFIYRSVNGENGQDSKYRFTPNIYHVGTRVYYDEKRVAFKGGYSADSFAVRTATFFALLSLVLFLFRVRDRLGR